MTKPLISIVIANYNSDKTLRETLATVINQSFQGWECVIVDGASKDGSVSIIQEFEAKNSRIRHISESDEGIYDAFNKGWKLAKGEWIYYLGADDSLFLDGLSQLIVGLDDVPENVAIISGGVLRIRQDGTEKVIMSHGFTGSHQSMLTRRSVLERMGGFNLEYKILADFDLFIRIKNVGYDVVNKPVVVAKFAAGGTSENPKYMRKVFFEKYRILKNDNFCMFPLLRTLIDTSKTQLGAWIHRAK